MGVHIAKREAVTMTTVVQAVASVTSLGRDAPECHLSDKFNPEISVSNVHTHTHTTQMCVCVYSLWLLPAGTAGPCCHGYPSIPTRVQDEIQNPAAHNAICAILQKP